MKRRYTHLMAGRYDDHQYYWLTAQAEKEGHGQKIVIIRRLIDNAMRRNANKKGRQS